MQKSRIASPTNKVLVSSAARSARVGAGMAMRWSLRTKLFAVALLWGVVAAILVTFTLARPWSFEIDVGGRWDGPYLDGFYGFERNAEGRFRWSKAAGEIYLPGVGPLSALDLRVHGGPEGKILRLSDGATTSELQIAPGWRRLHLLPQPDAWSGDVRFTLSADPQVDSDRRALGFVLDAMRLSGRPNAPPLGQGLLLGISVALGSGLAGWASRRAGVAALAGLALTAGAVYVLGNAGGAWRLYLTDDTGRLALVLGCSLLVGLASDWSLGRLGERKLIHLAPNGRRLLAAVVALAFLVRFGALSYPLNFPSDLRFNLARSWMVRDGKFLELFLPNADLTPVQWKSDITVPRTPFYYLIMSPLTWLPGAGPELAMMAISSAVDALAVGLVGLLVLVAGGGRRSALVAALLVATQSFSLVVVTSWGIYTTLLGQCFALLTVFLWSVLRSRLGERRVQYLIAAAMLGAFLSHPATLLLFGTTWALFVGLLLIQRDRLWRPTLRIILYASGGALLLYYGWQLPELVRRSLPTVFEALNGGRPLNTEASVAAASRGVLWPLLNEMYGRWLLGGAVVGAALLIHRLLADRQRIVTSSAFWRNRHSLAGLLLVWALIYPPFALADARVTLNYKHILFMLPLIAILTGLFYGGLARYRWGRVVVAALLALVAWQGLDLVVYKVMYAYIGLR